MGYSEIETIALRDVLLDKLKRPGVSPDFHLRRIFREYSHMFHTPLHEVYELPLDFVFQAWLEEYYEKQEVKDLQDEALAMTKDPAVLAAERRAEDAADAETHLFIVEERKVQEAMKKMEDVLQKFKQTVAPLIPRDADSQLVMAPAPPKPAEQITMHFDSNVDDDTFDSIGLFEGAVKKSQS